MIKIDIQSIVLMSKDPTIYGKQPLLPYHSKEKRTT